MAGSVGGCRVMCQPGGLLRSQDHRLSSREEIAAQPQQPAAPIFSQRLSFRASSVRLPAGLVVLGLIVLVFTALGSPARGQEATPPPAPRPAPPMDSSAAEQSKGATETGEASRGVPLTLTFQDALERARGLDLQLSAATADAESARQDRVQARATLLPSLNFTSQYLFTQGNAVRVESRYVTADGVHVYRVWPTFHQDFSAGTLTLTPYHRALAAEMLARAKVEIARRGLKVTLTKAYYDLVVAERKYATAQQSSANAKRFLQISQDLERGGEVAHSDVIKFELQANQADQGFREAKLAMDNARLTLAVMLFPDFNRNFTVVDDLSSPPALPPLAEVQAMAGRENPQLRSAIETLKESQLDVVTARQAFLPSLTVDTVYGIEANALALRSRVSADPQLGRLPNLGYFLTANISLPVWNWGAMRSKLKQAQLRRQQAQVELSFTQRQLISNLLAAYNEADTARFAAETLRRSADLATQSLRLNTLRYQAGEATVLELVDAATTLEQARNAYDDGEARYRLALANLQTLTGDF